MALAARLSTFARTPVNVDVPRIEGDTHKHGISLSEVQRRAVILAASSRLLVLTGGPSCDKTFTTKDRRAVESHGQISPLSSPD